VPRVKLFPSRLFWKICLTFSLLLLSITAAISWFVVDHVESIMMSDFISTLEDKAHLLEPQAIQLLTNQGHLTQSEMQNLIEELGKRIRTRITVIDQHGNVMVDSDGPIAYDIDHSNRPEVRDALVKPFGLARRDSANTGKSMLMVAKAIRDLDQNLLGLVRVSIPSETIHAEVDQIRRYD